MTKLIADVPITGFAPGSFPQRMWLNAQIVEGAIVRRGWRCLHLLFVLKETLINEPDAGDPAHTARDFLNCKPVEAYFGYLHNRLPTLFTRQTDCPMTW